MEFIELNLKKTLCYIFISTFNHVINTYPEQLISAVPMDVWLKIFDRAPKEWDDIPADIKSSKDVYDILFFGGTWSRMAEYLEIISTLDDDIKFGIMCAPSELELIQDLLACENGQDIVTLMREKYDFPAYNENVAELLVRNIKSV